MKQLYLGVRLLTGVGVVAVLSGCATKSDGARESRIESHPSSREISTSDPSPGATDSTTQASTLAEPAGALTLRQSLDLALAHSPELAVFSWEVRIGEARILQAGLRPNPEAGVEIENVLGTGAFRGAREAETTLQLSQLVELGGKRAARVKAASLSRDLAAWDYESRRIEVLAQTASSFIEVLSLQQRLALAQESVQLAERALDAVEKRVEAARTFAVEGTRAEVALATVQIERDQTQRELDAVRQRLAAHWGSTRPGFERAEGDLEQLANVPTLESLIEQLRQNPDITRWTTEIAQRKAGLDIEKSKRVPDIALGGGYRWLSGPDDSAVVAGISIPLPLFNRNQGHIREAEYQVARARDERRAAELRLTAALVHSWQRLSAAQAEVTAIRDKVLPGAQQTFDTMSEYYKDGRLGYLEVLDAQRTLFAARAQHFRALTDYHQAVIAVEQLTGGTVTPQGAFETNGASDE